MTEFLDYALGYSRRGLAVVPIRRGSKAPLVTGWQSRRLTEDELRNYLDNGHDPSGIGVVAGALSNNLVVLDFDGAGWQAAFDHVLHCWPEFETAPIVETGSGKRHIWLRCPDLPENFTRRTFARADLNAEIELRGNRCNNLAPPSRHPGGGRYRWLTAEADLVEVSFTDLRDWLAEWAGEPVAPARGAAAPVGDVIGEGERNNTLASIAGSMRRRGMTHEEIAAALHVVNQRRCNPPLPREEVENIAKSISRYKPALRRPIGDRMPPATADRIAKTAPDSPDPAIRERIFDVLVARGYDKGEKPAPAIRRQQAAEILLAWLREHGGFLQSESGELFYFYSSERQLFNLESDRWAAWLYSVTGANPAGTDYAHLAADCKAAALSSERRRVARVAFWNDDAQILHVSRFDGTVYCLNGETIAEEANGESVLFDDDPGWQPYRPDFDAMLGSELAWLTKDIPNWRSDPEMYGLAYRSWIISSFFTELCPTRPLLVFEGERGAGKSMSLRLLLRLMFGELGELSGVPDKPDGFTAAAAASHILAIDNLDRYTPWLRDKLARLSTGAVDEYRKLYTSNELMRIRYRCWLAFTSRTPDTLRRDDLADRLLLLPVKRIESGQTRPERDFLQQAAMFRAAWWADVLTLLNRVVAAIRRGELQSQSALRMADWESLGRVLARVEGNEALWNSFVDTLRQSQSDFLLENNLIVEGLELWLRDESNHDREVTARELYNELQELLFEDKRPTPDWPKSVLGFAKRLATIRRDLRSRCNVAWAEGRSRRVTYRFSPNKT